MFLIILEQKFIRSLYTKVPRFHVTVNSDVFYKLLQQNLSLFLQRLTVDDSTFCEQSVLPKGSKERVRVAVPVQRFLCLAHIFFVRRTIPLGIVLLVSRPRRSGQTSQK